MTRPEEVIEFWFTEIPPANWWKKDTDFDQLIQARFGACHRAAAQCELFAWRTSGLGRLAEILVLDQFSRNIFRDTRDAFAQDPAALVLAQEAVRAGADRELAARERSFLYMPYMHSESQLIHEEAVKIFKQTGLEYNYEFELKHKVIIDRFGRYPHRNAILGRQSTLEEQEFLKQPGTAF